MAQDLRDAIFVRIAEEESPRLSPYLAEALATLADGWRVHQRQHLFDIANQKSIEERLVYVLQVAEKGVFIEGGRLLIQRLHPPVELFVERPQVRRQQTVQVEYVTFVIGEGGSLVETGRVDQVISRKRNLIGFFVYCFLQLRGHLISPGFGLARYRVRFVLARSITSSPRPLSTARIR